MAKPDTIGKYVLDVMSQADDGWLKLESTTPFMAFHAGDLINPRSFGTLGYAGPDRDCVYQVKKVEHHLYKAEVLTHQIIVIVEEVADDYDARGWERAKKLAPMTGL